MADERREIIKKILILAIPSAIECILDTDRVIASIIVPRIRLAHIAREATFFILSRFPSPQDLDVNATTPTEAA